MLPFFDLIPWSLVTDCVIPTQTWLPLSCRIGLLLAYRHLWSWNRLCIIRLSLHYNRLPVRPMGNAKIRPMLVLRFRAQWKMECLVIIWYQAYILLLVPTWMCQSKDRIYFLYFLFSTLLICHNRVWCALLQLSNFLFALQYRFIYAGVFCKFFV